MPRIYHPSPNCPCQQCRAKYHDGHPAPRGLLQPAVSPYTRCRVRPSAMDLTPLGVTVRLASPLVDLLDMPPADRAVLIFVIQSRTRRKAGDV